MTGPGKVLAEYAGIPATWHFDYIAWIELLIALALLINVYYLYRISIALSRLDNRMDLLARHIRDMNLYDYFPPPETHVGGETDVEGPPPP